MVWTFVILCFCLVFFSDLQHRNQLMSLRDKLLRIYFYNLTIKLFQARQFPTIPSLISFYEQQDVPKILPQFANV